MDVNISSTHSSGQWFPIGDTTVTYYIVNETVSATCSFNVLVLGKDYHLILFLGDLYFNNG